MNHPTPPAAIAQRAGNGAQRERLEADLDRCLHEQAQLAEYLKGDGPDRAGAWRAIFDWTIEELLIRREMGC